MLVMNDRYRIRLERLAHIRSSQILAVLQWNRALAKLPSSELTETSIINVSARRCGGGGAASAP